MKQLHGIEPSLILALVAACFLLRQNVFCKRLKEDIKVCTKSKKEAKVEKSLKMADNTDKRRFIVIGLLSSE